MADPRTFRPVDRYVYAGLAVFVLIHFLGDTSNSLNRMFRNPGIALILLIVTQVLFPKFRASGLANMLSLLIITATIIHAAV